MHAQTLPMICIISIHKHKRSTNHHDLNKGLDNFVVVRKLCKAHGRIQSRKLSKK